VQDRDHQQMIEQVERSDNNGSWGVDVSVDEVECIAQPARQRFLSDDERW
jgi:hypothetical protein